MVATVPAKKNALKIESIRHYANVVISLMSELVRGKFSDLVKTFRLYEIFDVGLESDVKFSVTF